MVENKSRIRELQRRTSLSKKFNVTLVPNTLEPVLLERDTESFHAPFFNDLSREMHTPTWYIFLPKQKKKRTVRIATTCTSSHDIKSFLASFLPSLLKPPPPPFYPIPRIPTVSGHHNSPLEHWNNARVEIRWCKRKILTQGRRALNERRRYKPTGRWLIEIILCGTVRQKRKWSEKEEEEEASWTPCISYSGGGRGRGLSMRDICAPRRTTPRWNKFTCASPRSPNLPAAK